MNNNHRHKTLRCIFLAVFCLLLMLTTAAYAAPAAETKYSHLVVLGDPHISGNSKQDAKKMAAINTINSWNDVTMVIAVGDLCQQLGSDQEYEAAKAFFAALKKPFYPIAGNHDFIYDDHLDAKGRKKRADAPMRQAKLDRFKKSFGLQSSSYSIKASGYLLVLLSPDAGSHLAELSRKQLAWLQAELSRDRKTPTIVFFHAPLAGTLDNYNKNANTANFIAQPAAAIHDILSAHPQVFMWVSGHTHTTPAEPSFASSVNLYAGRITNIHNSNMNRKTVWTNSLFLYRDKVVVKTFDHGQGAWLPKLERTIMTPPLAKHAVF